MTNQPMIKAGDLVKIKPEWQDEGDDQFNFFSIDDQLDGMEYVRTCAVHKSTGKRCIGIQSIKLDMLEQE